MNTPGPPERVTLTEPLGEGVQRIMSVQLDLALLALEGLNPDVHAARKAMKRVRGLLRLVREPLGESTYRRENGALRDAARVLAPARDAAATIETFAGVGERHPRSIDADTAEDIATRLARDDRAQRDHLATNPTALPAVVAVLHETRQRITSLQIVPSETAEGTDFGSVEDGLRRMYKRCRRGLADVISNPSEEAFHRWRKAVKYLRYQLETLVAYSPSVLGACAQELDALGELLGSAQDLVVLSHTLVNGARKSDIRGPRAKQVTTLLEATSDDLAFLQRSAVAIGEPVFDRQAQVFVSSVRATFTKPEHRRIAEQAYGIVGTARPLPSEIDDIARIDASDGSSYVLRISPPTSYAGTLELIEAAAETATDHTIPAPRTVRTIDGADHAMLGDGRIARAQTWIAGEQIGSLPMSLEVATSLGHTAAALVKALAQMPEPHRTSHDHRWELSHAESTIAGLRHHISDATSRRLIDDSLERVALIPFDQMPAQVIHNDLNPENLLIADEEIVGVIDFGDVAWSIRVGELAIGCAYAMIDQDDPVEVAARVAGAFAAQAPVSPIEATWLFDLIIARLATSACIAASRGNANPHHQNTADGVWNLLGTLLATDRRWAIDRLASACLNAAPPTEPFATQKLARARAVLGPSLRLSYAKPLHITRGRGQYLYDSRGRRFLDGLNNVAHVGHAHPLVLEAAERQASMLNTNTRYLHAEALTYASRISRTLPDPLDTVILVNSGSEANELALRIAASATGRSQLVCLDHGYHGNTGLLVDVSPYKFDGPGGTGLKPGICVLPSPDPYRNPEFGGYRAGETYRAMADEALEGSRPAGLIIEALPGCGGQVVPEPGVIGAAYDAVRSLGGVVIADEVQTGLGRVGADFWAFELHDVVPDIVTIGKPAGNGHPLAAVVTTAALADAFDNGMEYFNTFGGNPVSAAIGNAVLDVIDHERLQAKARILGQHLIDGLAQLSRTHGAIGDVRGAGLFIGIELVSDRLAKVPDASLATAVAEFAKAAGVLLSTDGPHHNVIKIKPPLVVSMDDCDRFISTIDAALTTVA